MENIISIQTIEHTGPVTKNLNIDEAITFLNIERSNNKLIFVNGKPILNEDISENTLKNIKGNVLVLNELVGG